MNSIEKLLNEIFNNTFTKEDKDKIRLLNKQNQNNYEKFIRELKKNKELINKIDNLKYFINNKIKETKGKEEDLSLYLGKLIAYQTILNYIEEKF